MKSSTQEQHIFDSKDQSIAATPVKYSHKYKYTQLSPILEAPEGIA